MPKGQSYRLAIKQAVRVLNENKALKYMLPTTVTTILKDGVSKIAMQSNTPVFFISTMRNWGICAK